MKNRTRMSLTSLALAAVAATSFFLTACSGGTTTPTDEAPAYTTTLTQEAIDTPEDTITNTDSDSFSIKYKYWYDNPDVAATQTQTQDGTDTGEMLLGTNKVYEDSTGKYIMSGRTQVYLNNNTIPKAASDLLRNDNGEKVYGLMQRTLSDIQATLADHSDQLDLIQQTQPVTYEERITGDATTTAQVAESVQLFINNIPTEYYVTNGIIPIHYIYNTTALGYVVPVGEDIEIHMLTAAGDITVTLADSIGDTVTVRYSTDDSETQAPSSDIVIDESNTVSMSVDAIESYLGYDVEVYTDFINVVTDNKDLFSSSNYVDKSTMLSHITENQSDPVADQIAQEREESIPIATTEEAEEHQQQREDWQEMTDNTTAYTTEGIPLTTDGGLTAPAKPTANYKLPAGAQLEFTGNADTALLTELPDGCYWTPGPTAASANRFTDPAGNIWMNTNPETIPFAERSRNSGYYSPDGDYHPSQYEIDEAARFNAEMSERHENGPTNGEHGLDGATQEEINNLWDMLGG